MFDVIEEEILKALRANITTVPKANIGVRRPDSKGGGLPAISIASSDFLIGQAAMGSGFETSKEEVQDKFDGDGKTATYTLSEKPVRPLVSVENPEGTVRKESDDYIVDYPKSLVVFRSPPEKGKKVSVRYYSEKSAGETRALKLAVKYVLDVWASDEGERDKVAVDVMKALLVSQEELSRKDIGVNPMEGTNILPEDGGANPGVFGKRLVYEFETHLKVKTAVPRIEKIEERVEREGHEQPS